ncbi:MAG: hypothetical protein MK105_05145 [Crocinitomicaceae bacterium]|nr:hypothetical protein [Crocinitomicaceae bacterium]
MIKLEERYIQFSIEIIPIDTSLKTRQSAALYNDSNMIVYFADKPSHIGFKMACLYNTILVLDQTTQKAIYLTNSSKGKFASVSSTKGIEPKQMTKYPNTITKYFDETRMTLGYKCKKATVLSNGLTITYWYTDKISTNQKNRSIINPNTLGLSISFSRKENGIEAGKSSSHFVYREINFCR